MAKPHIAELEQDCRMQTARIEALKKQASGIAALKQQAALLGQLERAGTITAAAR
ncbi:MAG: hypothetical protein HY083_06455 [Gammaproteobacteria bacterium]|nr:hypothetical protein [Gammaproteobacteria bacterium]